MLFEWRLEAGNPLYVAASPCDHPKSQCARAYTLKAGVRALFNQLTAEFSFKNLKSRGMRN